MINSINNVSFSGTYRISSADNDYNKILDTTDYFGRLYFETDVEEHHTYPTKLGEHTNLTYVISDEADFSAEEFMASKGIQYKKYEKEELFAENAIKSRMYVPEHLAEQGFELVEVDTEKFNETYRGSDSFGYIGDKGEVDGAYLCDNFMRYLKTGLNIEAPQVHLCEENGELGISFFDGRHRYATMRDMLNFKTIPVAMSQESITLAQKHGLI